MVGSRHVDIVRAFLQLILVIVGGKDTILASRTSDGHIAGEGIGDLYRGTLDMRTVAVVSPQGVSIHHVDNESSDVGAHHRTLHLYVKLVTILWRQSYDGLVLAVDNQVLIACEIQRHRGLAVLGYRG